MQKLLAVLILSVLTCSFRLMVSERPADDPKKVEAEKKRAEKFSALTKNYYLNLSGKYASPYKTILQYSYCGPDCFTTYINGQLTGWNYDTSAAVLFPDYHSVIHESVHRYNSSKGKIGRHHYLVEPGIEIDVDEFSVFHSSEIRKVITVDADLKISRYDTYVSESSTVSANEDGIYGLLEEFSAYNNGTRACVLGAETALQKGDTDLAFRFIESVNRTFPAYYEFNLFITWYLKTAELYYPETYEALQADTSLRTAYTLLDQSYAETISRMLNAGLVIKKAKGKDPVEGNDRVYGRYPNELLLIEQKWLNRFRMPGISKTDYKLK